MNIEMFTIPHEYQSYPTCGDYNISPDGNAIEVIVSQMKDRRHEWLVAIHEIVEAVLCIQAGVSEQSICDFDIAFEKAREAANCRGFYFMGRHYQPDAEPGDSPDAPYQRQHNFATAVERMVCAELGVLWSDYEKEVLDL